jgi:hypothetical protein
MSRNSVFLRLPVWWQWELYNQPATASRETQSAPGTLLALGNPEFSEQPDDGREPDAFSTAASYRKERFPFDLSSSVSDALEQFVPWHIAVHQDLSQFLLHRVPLFLGGNFDTIYEIIWEVTDRDRRHLTPPL